MTAYVCVHGHIIFWVDYWQKTCLDAKKMSIIVIKELCVESYLIHDSFPAPKYTRVGPNFHQFSYLQLFFLMWRGIEGRFWKCLK